MDDKTIKEKLKFYAGKNIELHIVKKPRTETFEPEWLNCFIISEETPEVYVIKERKFGIMHLFVSEISTIELCRRENGTT